MIYFFQIFLSFFRFSFLTATGQKRKQKLLTPGCSGPRRQKHEINEEGFKVKIHSHKAKAGLQPARPRLDFRAKKVVQKCDR